MFKPRGHEELYDLISLCGFIVNLRSVRVCDADSTKMEKIFKDSGAIYFELMPDRRMTKVQSIV
jgi:hypothetical protein